LKTAERIWGWKRSANGQASHRPHYRVLLGLFSLVTVLSMQLSQDGESPLPVTAWSDKTEPAFADCLAVVRRHLWCARYVVNSAVKPEFVQFPREAFELLLQDLPAAA
jgi:hypothetical protein